MCPGRDLINAPECLTGLYIFIENIHRSAPLSVFVVFEIELRIKYIFVHEDLILAYIGFCCGCGINRRNSIVSEYQRGARYVIILQRVVGVVVRRLEVLAWVEELIFYIGFFSRDRKIFSLDELPFVLGRRGDTILVEESIRSFLVQAVDAFVDTALLSALN